MTANKDNNRREGGNKRRWGDHKPRSSHNVHNPNRISIWVEGLETFYECDAEGEQVEDAPQAEQPRNGRILYVSVPVVVRHHRDRPVPDTLEVGRISAGSLDLALNILTSLYPPGCEGEKPVRLKVNLTSATAYRLHEKFCADFLAPMDPEGREIPVEQIRSWVERLDRVKHNSLHNYGRIEDTD